MDKILDVGDVTMCLGQDNSCTGRFFMNFTQCLQKHSELISEITAFYFSQFPILLFTNDFCRMLQ